MPRIGAKRRRHQLCDCMLRQFDVRNVLYRYSDKHAHGMRRSGLGSCACTVRSEAVVSANTKKCGMGKYVCMIAHVQLSYAIAVHVHNRLHISNDMALAAREWRILTLIGTPMK